MSKNQNIRLAQQFRQAHAAEFSTRALVIGGLGFLALLTALYLLVQSIGGEELALMVEGAGIWGPVVYIAIKALTFTFAPLSAGPIQFASGILFGVIPGTLYSVLGEVIGGAVNVMIARHARPAHRQALCRRRCLGAH